MRKLLALAVILLLVYGISQNPGQSADTAAALGDHIAQGLRGAGTFIHQLVT